MYFVCVGFFFWGGWVFYWVVVLFVGLGVVGWVFLGGGVVGFWGSFGVFYYYYNYSYLFGCFLGFLFYFNLFFGRGGGGVSVITTFRIFDKTNFKLYKKYLLHIFVIH